MKSDTRKLRTGIHGEPQKSRAKALLECGRWECSSPTGECGNVGNVGNVDQIAECWGGKADFLRTFQSTEYAVQGGPEKFGYLGMG
jgi:hypothetical protein